MPVDNDCNGSPDAPQEAVDADGDGFPACMDCDDNDAGNFPGNREVCDGRVRQLQLVCAMIGGDRVAIGRLAWCFVFEATRRSLVRRVIGPNHARTTTAI